MRNTYVEDREYQSFVKLTVTDTASVTFASSDLVPPAGDYRTRHAEAAFCRLEDNQIRYRLDAASSLVSDTSGVLLEIGETLTLTGVNNLNRFRAIGTAAGDGVLQVHFGF